MRPFQRPGALGSAFVLLVSYTSHPFVVAWDPFFSACPQSCAVSGLDSRDWTSYYNVERLVACPDAVSLDFTIHNRIDDSATQELIFACTGMPEDSTAGNSTCGEAIQQNAPLNTISNAAGPNNSSSIIAAAKQAQMQFSHGSCNGTVAMGYSNGAVVAAFAGSQIQNEGAVSFVQDLIDSYRASPNSAPQTMQICGSNRHPNYALGVFAAQASPLDPRAALASAQKALVSWQKGECLSGLGGSSSWSTTTVWQTSQYDNTSSSSNSTLSANITGAASGSMHRRLLPRGECEDTQVGNPDSCENLARKCHIDSPTFTKYNPNPALCGNLKPGQWVCCTEGTLRDHRPKPQPDGTCATWDVVTDESCSSIAGANTLDITDIDEFNKNTWGWMGCSNLQVGQRICLSKGDPPMPASFANALCGPQVPGTEKPTNGTELKHLNPCPLNACCNVWGQCGVDAEFCKEYDSPTGAPGTAPPGSNGCISSCGTDIVNVQPPSSKMKIGYFETWNPDRPCLHMDIRQMAGNGYTHIHWAFANITESYGVDVSASQQSFDDMKDMSDVKKIVSFGGWGFSTEGATFAIFRMGVSDANRQLFAQNVAKFVKTNDLDGVDFDWEYPGAPDIPGIPPGDPGDGERYLQFLKMVRKELPDKSISIAAPASYWYLKGFPIGKISDVVDYIVYMTYDLHGQWDLGNQWAQTGCSQTGCLRSHVNLTETNYALAMVTKAGVPTGKLVIGVSSYGRAFQMSDSSCTGPSCTFTSGGSDGGDCTATSGYLANAELSTLISSGKAKTWFDDDSDSDMITWGSNWAAYMTDTTKSRRISSYIDKGFAGSVDWAVDLQYSRVEYDADAPPLYGHGVSGGIDPYSVSCKDPHIKEMIQGDWDERLWKAVGADVRWEQLTKKCKDSDDIWSECIGKSIGASVNMNCYILGEASNCDNEPRISDCANRDTAADWVIENSMTGVHQWYYNLYDSFQTATQEAMYSDITTFSEWFGVQPIEANKAIDIGVTVGISIFGALTSFIGGGVGNFASGFFQKGLNDAVKWGTINSASTVLTKVVNTPTEATTQSNWFANQGISGMSNYTVTLFGKIVEHYFGGVDDGPEHLAAVMSAGYFVGSNRQPSLSGPDAYYAWMPYIFGPLMPKLWNIGYSGGGANVYILDTEESCSTDFEDYKNFDERWSKWNKVNWGRQCACGRGAVRRYCIVMASRVKSKKGVPILWTPTGITTMYNAPNYIEPSEGDFIWKDVSVWHIINAALATYADNGGTNTYRDPTKIESFDEIDDLESSGLFTPGLVDIPTCAWDQAMRNYDDGYKDWMGHLYPCVVL